MNFCHARIVFFNVFIFQFNNHLKIDFSILNEFASFSIKNIENYVFDDNLICCLYSIKLSIVDNDASIVFKKCIDFKNNETIANVDNYLNIVES